jgi:hypothetical protein
MVLHAGCLAGGVTATVGLTLGVVGGADEVGDCLGVFGGIWGLAIAADAGVVEGILKIEGLVEVNCCRARRIAYRVAGVAVCGGSAVGQLEANQRARRLLLTAPLVCDNIRCHVTKDKISNWSSPRVAIGMVLGSID